MADDPRPKKKSRLKEFISTFRPSSKQGHQVQVQPPPQQQQRQPERPVTPPNQILVNGNQVKAHVPQTPLSNRFNTQHAPAFSLTLGQRGWESSLPGLASPTSETAAAFKNLTVDDRTPKGPRRDDVSSGFDVGTATLSRTQSRSAADYGQHVTPSTQGVNCHQNMELDEDSEATPRQSSTGSVVTKPALPSAAPTYAPSYIAPRPKPVVEGDRKPSTLHLPAEDHTPDPVPAHPGTNIRNILHHYRDRFGNAIPDPPPNLYTSPVDHLYTTSPNFRNYVQAQSQQNRKRKRSVTSNSVDIDIDTPCPPDAHIYQRTDKPTFNIFTGILLYPELCFELALALPLADLISLYSISRDFHTILDTRFTMLLTSLARQRAPTAASVFDFHCYPHLCRTDAAVRVPHPDPAIAAMGGIRKVPSFNWLQMVFYREKVVQEILALSFARGVRIPAACRRSLLHMWFMLDLPSNSLRVGYARNTALLRDVDVFFGVCVGVKLDMLFNSPLGTEKRDGLRRLLLSQRSLTPLLLVLRGEIWDSKLSVMREWVKLKYEPNARDYSECKDTGVWGVPVHMCGRGNYEGWGDAGFVRPDGVVRELIRPDQIMIREGLRRGMRFREAVVQCLLYGYVDPLTLGNVDWSAEYRADGVSRRARVMEMEGEYNFDDLVGGARFVPGVADGGDALLDVGCRKRRGWPRGTLKRDTMASQEVQWRKGESDFNEKCFGWWLQGGVEPGRWNVDGEGDWMSYDDYE